jgi:hypothetical protein
MPAITTTPPAASSMKTPSASGGGDVNLYRYAGNNPVNHTDPSGNALYVSAEDQVGSPGSPMSGPAYSLAYVYIKSGFTLNSSLRGEPFRLYYKSAIQAEGGIFSSIDFFNTLPAYFWNTLATDTGYFAQLIKPAILGTMDEKKVLYKPSSGDWALRDFKKAFLDKIWDLIDQVGRVFAWLGEKLFEGVKLVAQAGLTALLWAVGINPDVFYRFMESFAKSAGAIISGIFDDAKNFFGNLLKGLREGFKDFVSNIAQNLLRGIAVALFDEDADKVTPPKSLDLVPIARYFLALSGIDLAKFTRWTEELEAEGDFVDQLLDGLKNKRFKVLLNLLADFNAGRAIADQVDLVQLADDFKNKQLIPLILNALIKKVPLYIGKLAGGGWLLSIWKLIQFVVNNFKKLTDLFTTFIQAVAAAGGKSYKPVARKVLAGLKKSVVLVFSLLIHLVGLDDKVEKVNTWVQKKRQWLESRLQRFLTWLGIRSGVEATAKDPKKTTTARIEGVPSSPKQGRKAKGKGGGKGKGSFRLFARFGKGKNQDLTQLLEAWGKSCHVSVRSRVQDAKNQGQEVLNLAQAAEGGVPKVKRGLQELANTLNTLVDNCGACQTFLTATPGKCFGLATGVDPRSLADPGLRIEGIQVGFKVATLPPEEGHRTEICPRLVEGGACWRVGLMLEHDDGNGVDVVLLCGEKWLAEHGVRLGARVFLDMPEMGACGEAEVRSLELFAERIWAEPGRVTGTFRHRWGTVYELRVEGEGKPIVVTGGHPYWSPDRQAWVPVKGLRFGERLLARDGGTPRVESLALRAEPEPVYNIEVEGDHCYRVGEQGLLVHNMSVKKDDEPEPCPPDLNHLFKDFKFPKSYPAPTGTTEEILRDLKSRVGSRPGYAILVIGNEAYYLKTPTNTTPSSNPEIEWGSGYAPAEATDIGRGFTRRNRGHTDAWAASLLRMLVANGRQVKDAVMYGIPRPCTVGEVGCAPNLPKMLPTGTTLKVYWISTAGKVGEDDPYVGEG